VPTPLTLGDEERPRVVPRHRTCGPPRGLSFHVKHSAGNEPAVIWAARFVQNFLRYTLNFALDLMLGIRDGNLAFDGGSNSASGLTKSGGSD
jgi:hypothetical protein